MSLHRFDHAAAKAWYVSLDPGERSSRAVAEKFGVSETTISKWRRLETWDDAALEADRAASVAVQRQAVKTREQRALQDARRRDLAADIVEKKLELATDGKADVSDEWIAKVLLDADKHVRLNEGAATDHVEVAQVQAGFRESLGAAAELVASLVGRGLSGDELVRVFRQELPGQVRERLALIGGDDG